MARVMIAALLLFAGTAHAWKPAAMAKAREQCGEMLLCATQNDANLRRDCETKLLATGVVLCSRALDGIAQQYGESNDVRTLVDWFPVNSANETVRGSEKCGKDIGGCRAALRLGDAAPLLRFVESSCAGLDAEAWQWSEREPSPGLEPTQFPGMYRCTRAIDLLRHSAPTDTWRIAQRQRREFLLDRCTRPLTCPRDSAVCTDLPLCAAAIAKVDCDGVVGCRAWLSKRANVWQTQQTMAEVTLREAVRRREQERQIAADQVGEQRTGREWRAFADSFMRDLYEARTEQQARAMEAQLEALRKQTEMLQLGFGTLGESIKSIADALAGSKEPTSRIRQQLDPDQPLDEVYPEAKAIEYAVLVLPDPRVPRHKRSYELALRSVIAGMSDEDYVLDRYYFPWQDYDTDAAPKGDKADRWRTSDQTDDGKHGQLVFRHDDWRGNDKHDGKVSLRVFYVVAETVTFGVQRRALHNAVNRAIDEVQGTAIAARIPGDKYRQRFRAGVHHYLRPPTKLPCDKGSYCPQLQASSDPRLLIVGPTFSSSTSSMRAQIDQSLAESRPPIPAAVRAQLETIRGVVTRRRPSEIKDPEEYTTLLQLKQATVELERVLDKRDVYGIRQFVDKYSRDDVRDAIDAVDAQRFPALSDAINAFRLAVVYLHELDEFVACNASVRLKAVAVSSSTTAETNPRINGEEASLGQYSLAVSDKKKLEAVSKYLTEQGCEHPSCGVAFLYESTSFGRGAIKSAKTVDRNEWISLPFPPNIADLRARMKAKDDDAKRDLGVVSLAADDRHLPIEESVENGNEYPTENSAMATTTADQQLRQMLLRLREREIKYVIVAATDVRDRLYLFDRVSRELPGVRLIDLEADILLGHPDYVHATRGALVVASAPFVLDSSNGKPWLPCQREEDSKSGALLSFDSDKNSLLYGFMRCLGASEWRGFEPLLYRIGREGPLWVDGQIQAARPELGSVSTRGGLSAPWASIYGVIVLMVAVLLLGIVGFIVLPLPQYANVTSVHRAPWWRERRINASKMFVWTPLFIVVATVLLWPLIQQHASFSTYMHLLYRAHPGGRLVLLALVGWIALAVIAAAVTRRQLYRLPPLGRDWGIALVVLSLVVLVPVALGSCRCTQFLAPVGDDVALVWLHFSLWIVALVALLFVVGANRRLLRWTGYAARLIRSAQHGQELGDWAVLAGPKPRFVSTPLEAGFRTSMYEITEMPIDPAGVEAQLAQLEAGYEDSLAARMTLRRLLWPSLHAATLSSLALTLACFGIVGVAWLYPVPNRGVPLVLGMMIAALGAAALTAAAIAYERSGLLSRLFCGTPKGVQVSTQFLAWAVGPILLFVLSVIAADQPGVLEWSGGILKLLTGGH